MLLFKALYDSDDIRNENRQETNTAYPKAGVPGCLKICRMMIFIVKFVIKITNLEQDLTLTLTMNFTVCHRQRASLMKIAMIQSSISDDIHYRCTQ